MSVLWTISCLLGAAGWTTFVGFLFFNNNLISIKSIEAVGRRWRNLPIHLGNTCFDTEKRVEAEGCGASRGRWFQPDPCTVREPYTMPCSCCHG